MFFVFRAYLQIVKDLLLISITKRTIVIYKTIKEIYRLNTEQQVKKTLVIRNNLNTK
jgi:hypothetical protein